MKRLAGYTAITTVIMLTLVLTVVSASIAFVSLYGRFSAAGATHKQQSRDRAIACLEEALLRLSQDNTYVGNESISLSTGGCTIELIAASGPNKIIETSATEHESVTRYRLTVNAETLVTQSQVEI